MNTNPYLALLLECGVPLTREYQDTFLRLHGSPPPDTSGPDPDPSDGHVVTRDEYDILRPEQQGHHTYTVMATRESEHPFATNDPSLWSHTTRTRIHNYDRCYHFRWVLSHTIGIIGAQVDPSFLEELRQAISLPLTDPLIYHHLRSILRRKRQQVLYLSIPSLIQKLGGPAWTLPPPSVFDELLMDFKSIHHTFSRYKYHLGRKRFPKMIFMVMVLLDVYRVDPPYDLPWTHTDIYMNRLTRLCNQLLDLNDYDKRTNGSFKKLPPLLCSLQNTFISFPDPNHRTRPPSRYENVPILTSLSMGETPSPLDEMLFTPPNRIPHHPHSGPDRGH